MRLYLVCLVLSCAGLAELYPTGAPLNRCGDMIPHHKVDPLEDAPPYEILVTPVGPRNSQIYNSKYIIYFYEFHFVFFLKFHKN
jgi:hypothetical protein